MLQVKIWDSIAEGWNNFRQKPFPSIINEVALEWKIGKILDIGCGNCRNLIPFAKNGFSCYGIDFSENMLKFAKKLCDKNKVNVKLKLGKAEKLPFKKESFDYCLNIASLHHVETSERRKKALDKMYRVLKPRGKALIFVWNKLQPKFLFKPTNSYVSWRRKGKVYWRYYHLFNYWELKKLLKKHSFKILYSEGIVGRELTFIVQK